MLIRIVRMSFEPEKVTEFLEIFQKSQTKISSFEGCHGVELMQDYNEKNVFYTYSKWDNQDCLNNYRYSELFEKVWKATKTLFNDKPLAYSLKKADLK